MNGNGSQFVVIELKNPNRSRRGVRIVSTNREDNLAGGIVSHHVIKVGISWKTAGVRDANIPVIIRIVDEGRRAYNRLAGYEGLSTKTPDC